MKRVGCIMLISIGFICAGIGSVGIFLPILPTTPFYLLALACFAKSSKRFHRWFTETKMYQKHLNDFVESRSMTRKTKICILAPVTLILTVVAVRVQSIHMRITLVVLLAIKYYYFIFKIKTVGDNHD